MQAQTYDPAAASNPPELAPDSGDGARLKNALDVYRKDVAKGSAEVEQRRRVRGRRQVSRGASAVSRAMTSQDLRRQRGAVIVLVAVGMRALILCAALALDVGHALLNKTRLQNTVDAAALAAAKAFDDTGNTTLATAEAMQAFGSNAAAAGNSELNACLRVRQRRHPGDGRILRHAAAVHTGLRDGSLRARDGHGIRTASLACAVSAASIRKTVAATAVAGPAYADCRQHRLQHRTDDGVRRHRGASRDCGATQLNSPQVLKKSTPGGQSQVGPGNFQLIQLGGSGRRRRAREHGRQLSTHAWSAAARSRRRPVTRPVRLRKGSTRASASTTGPMNGTAVDVSARCHRRRSIAAAAMRDRKRRPGAGL